MKNGNDVGNSAESLVEPKQFELWLKEKIQECNDLMDATWSQSHEFPAYSKMRWAYSFVLESYTNEINAKDHQPSEASAVNPLVEDNK